jgi:hypothetical protein
MLQGSAKDSSILSFLGNPVFLSAFSSLFITQLIKAFISLLRTRARSLREIFITLLWRTGGMPSSHAALCVSLSTAIGFREGFNSSVFVLSFFFCLVVIRDALGVRRSAGLIARSLNQLGRDLGPRLGMEFNPIKEVNGHTPTEVFVGCLLGFSIALAFSLL